MHELISLMSEDLFNYKTKDFTDKLISIFEIMQYKIVMLDENETEDFLYGNQLIQDALNSGDYLFISDMLKYFFLPMFDKKEH